MADAIFISYRRDDSEGEAGRLFDDLIRAFGNDAVFMDVAGIKPGVDFRKAIEDHVASCGVLLAIVGPTWASITHADGKRRLEDPNDFVALEIASALRREVPVIPVLVHEAKMPSADLLPEGLKNFSYHNSVELSHARWNSDVQLLVEALRSYVKPAKTASPEPVHATVPVQLPAPHPVESGIDSVAKRSNLPVRAGAIAALGVAIALSVYFALHKSVAAPTPDPSNGTTTSQSVEPAAATTAATTAPSGVIGTWTRRIENTGNNLHRLVITGSGSTVMIHAYGGCQPIACDWGNQPAQFDANQNAIATFTVQPAGGSAKASRTATVTVHRVGDTLDVLVDNTFTTPQGTREEQNHFSFVPEP